MLNTGIGVTVQTNTSTILTHSGVSYQFDAAQNTILRVDARSWPTTFTADALNRTVGEAFRDGTLVTNVFNVAGEQTSTSDVTGTRSFGYDLNSRLTSVAMPNNLILTYQLNSVNDRVLMIDCDSGLTTYGFDQQSRLNSIINPVAERTTITHDALDREQWKQLGNGMIVSLTFDPAGRETARQNLSATGTALAIFTNSYDAVSNRLTVLELGGVLVTYGYDPSYQLVNEQRSGSTPFNYTLAYDGLGNRTVKTDSGNLTTYTTNAANELLETQAQISTMSYQIYAGGATADSNFSADAFFSSPGTMITQTYASSVSTTGLVDPAPEGAYQTIRYVNASVGPLVYTIPNLTPSENYRVRLHFATSEDGGSGRRNLSITINSQIVASGLDIYALAGGDLKCYIAEYVGTADGSGTIVVSILGDGTKMYINPFLNAIEVLIWKHKINSGGSLQGAWVADEYVSSTGTITNGSTGSTISLTAVTDPAPEAVYQDLVYVAGTIGPLVYTIPSLTPGANYRIRLHFATFSDGGSGRRSLSVAVNGTTLISALDVYATAGGDLIALIETLTANADSTGTLTISITADQTKMWKNPFINGLEIRSNGTTNLSYDQNGNLSTQVAWTGITTNTWDTENRLLSVNAGLNGTETYSYSSDGLRQKKVYAGGSDNFVWDGQNILQERDVNESKIAQYTGYPGYWGGLASMRRGTASSFYGFDSQSSSRILVSIGGAITDNYGFRAFGEPLSEGGGTINPYRYVGLFQYYFDAVIRLYVRARIVDPTQARWMSQDPSNLGGADANSYTVVENTPITTADPTGLGPIRWTPIQLVPFSRPRAKCSEVQACFLTVSHVSCCGHKPITPQDVATMLCIFSQENSGMKPPGNLPAQGGEGLGNITGGDKGAFKELGRRGCNSVAPYKTYSQFLKASDCQKAIAALEFLSCVGLCGYGNQSTVGDYCKDPTLAKTLDECVKCVMNPDTTLNCGRIGPPASLGNPDAICADCLTIIHATRSDD